MESYNIGPGVNHETKASWRGSLDGNRLIMVKGKAQ